MQQTQKLPALKDIREFAYGLGPFPTTGLGIAQLAERSGYGETLVNFLKLFSAEAIFYSRQHFLQTCLLLKKLIREEQSMPPENLREGDD